MSGNPKNTEAACQGQTITLDVWFRAYYGGPLVDPDTVPLYTIYDPEGVAVYTNTSTKRSTGYYEATYTIPDDAALSTRWSIEWSAYLNGAQITGASEYFRVLAPGSIEFDVQIFIDDTWMHQIKKIVAYPKVDELILSDDEIKEYAIYPAMMQYFTKFPLKVYQESSIAQQAIISFPDDYTYGVLDCRIVDVGMMSGQGGSFWDIVANQMMGGQYGNGTGAYGIKNYNPSGALQMRTLQRQALKSQMNSMITLKYFVDQKEKTVTAYTNGSGKLNITWAKWSNYFDDVIFERRLEVVQLAQSYLLTYLADLTSIVTDSALDISVNADSLRTRAQELYSSVIDTWKEFPDIILVHGA